MAGDHKCPVCASTFTRPQHVHRHMRSHTGDRPYKCNHCGDQFARSDLLSRHVNKCHAAEKPPTTTQPARRKGHAQPGSSSTGGVRGPLPSLAAPPGDVGVDVHGLGLGRRICDACAVSRTPAQCDAGLPCGKCLQRSTKCIYMKASEASRRSVQMSTVPIISSHTALPGAGMPSISIARPPHQQPHPHQLSQLQLQHQLSQHQHQNQLSHDILASPPTVPSMAGPRPGAGAAVGASMGVHPGTSMGVDTTLFGPQGHAQQQTFNFTVPLYPQSLDLRGDGSPQVTHATAFADQVHAHSHAPPNVVSYPDPHSGKALDAFLAGYNPPPVSAADFLYNTGVDLTGQGPQQQGGVEGGEMRQVEPGQQHQHQVPSHHQQHQHQQPNNMHMYDFDPTRVFEFGAHSNQPPPPPQQQQQQQQQSQQHLQSQSRVDGEYAFDQLASHVQPYPQGALRAGPEEGILHTTRGEDMLRDAGQMHHDNASNDGGLHHPNVATAATSSASVATSLLAPPEGGFSNAFGLMSLDDPIVAAEMNKDGSFFAPGALPGGGSASGAGLGSFGIEGGMGVEGMGMGMGTDIGGLGGGTPGRDSSLAELREFWKAFMRTPGEKMPGTGIMNGAAGRPGGPVSQSQSQGGLQGQNQGGAQAHGQPNGVTQGGVQDSRPQGLRRSLSKIASLPDIKTPPTQGTGTGTRMAGGEGIYGAAGQAQTQGVYHGFGVGGQGGVGEEDLRSYEMAVMARPAPRLTLVPRKRATLPREGPAAAGAVGQQGQVPNAQIPTQQSSAPQQQQQQQTQVSCQEAQQQHRHLSPHISSKSSSSSPALGAAVAVGSTTGGSPSASVGSGVSGGSGGEGGEGGSAAPSHSAAGGGGNGGADGSGGEGSGGSTRHSPHHTARAQTYPTTHSRGNGPASIHARPHDARHITNTQTRERPTFKRLASQTLGPFESKSVKMTHGDSGDVKLEVEQLDSTLGVEGVDGSGEGKAHNTTSGNNKNTNDKVNIANSTAYSHSDATTNRTSMVISAPNVGSQMRHHPRKLSVAYGETLSHTQGQAHGDVSGQEFYNQHSQHRRLSAPSQSATRPAFGGM